MCEIRMAPQPHRYAVCAPEGMPIKDFYKDVFEEVFVFFHPFIKPKNIDFELFHPDTYPSRNDIRDNCEMVTWKQFLSLSGIENFKQLDIGLRTNILGLREEHEDLETAALIETAILKNSIAPPNEGQFPEFVMNNILKEITNLGHNWIWVGDEFCSKRKLEYITDLITDNNKLDDGKNLFTHDNSILITTHWDSHFSLLCSDRQTLKHLVTTCNLEGFYCTEATEIYWSLSKETLEYIGG